MDVRERLDHWISGYQDSLMLLTAAKLGVFAAMGRDKCSAVDLARACRLDAIALERLMLALAGMGVVDCDAMCHFQINEHFTPFLLPDSPLSLASMIEHNAHCHERWAEALEPTLRSGRPPARKPVNDDPVRMRAFICGMRDISRRSSEDVAAAVDMSRFRRMLDMGGGPGTAAITFVRHNPELSAVVFDLPGPCSIARELIDEAGLGDRVEAREGDYFFDDFGVGFDLVYVSNIVHNLGENDVAMVARKAYRALEPGGVLIVKDFYLDEDRCHPPYAARFSLHMMVSTDDGKTYTRSEMQTILCREGFGDFEEAEVAGHSSLIIGVRQ